MKKKVLLFLVLATLVAGGAFAQKVGDTANVFSKNYTVKDIRDGEVILMLTPTLDGTWKIEGGSIFTFNGNSAVYKQLSSSAVYQDAKNKGYVKVGDQVFRNIKKTNDLTWTAQFQFVQFNNNAPNVCIGTAWGNCTITLNPDGKTFQLYSGNLTTGQYQTLTRQ
jgi:hypothetical protein